MQFQLLNSLDMNYVPSLKSKDVHLVGFAELGMAYFRDYLVFAFGFTMEDAIGLCERINHSDEAGTIYPLGFLTGLPVRFFRSPLNARNIDRFRVCLRDAFVANRDYCKSPEMVFHYGCAISNRDEIIDETIRMANKVMDDPSLKLVTIVADSTLAVTDLQKESFLIR
jgi:hypothetical protein